jgi:hypothetical protein
LLVEDEFGVCACEDDDAVHTLSVLDARTLAIRREAEERASKERKGKKRDNFSWFSVTSKQRDSSKEKKNKHTHTHTRARARAKKKKSLIPTRSSCVRSAAA